MITMKSLNNKIIKISILMFLSVKNFAAEEQKNIPIFYFTDEENVHKTIFSIESAIKNQQKKDYCYNFFIYVDEDIEELNKYVNKKKNEQNEKNAKDELNAKNFTITKINDDYFKPEEIKEKEKKMKENKEKKNKKLDPLVRFFIQFFFMKEIENHNSKGDKKSKLTIKNNLSYLNCEKAIFLDNDAYVRGDLSTFFEMDFLEGKNYGAIEIQEEKNQEALDEIASVKNRIKNHLVKNEIEDPLFDEQKKEEKKFFQHLKNLIENNKLQENYSPKVFLMNVKEENLNKQLDYLNKLKFLNSDLENKKYPHYILFNILFHETVKNLSNNFSYEKWPKNEIKEEGDKPLFPVIFLNKDEEPWGEYIKNNNINEIIQLYEEIAPKYDLIKEKEKKEDNKENETCCSKCCDC